MNIYSSNFRGIIFRLLLPLLLLSGSYQQCNRVPIAKYCLVDVVFNEWRLSREKHVHLGTCLPKKVRDLLKKGPSAQTVRIATGATFLVFLIYSTFRRCCKVLLSSQGCKKSSLVPAVQGSKVI